MDTNLAALMIAQETLARLGTAQRDREQAHALLESRATGHTRLIDRILGRDRPKTETLDLVCCPA